MWKERTIKAIKELIVEYKELGLERSLACPICRLYGSNSGCNVCIQRTNKKKDNNPPCCWYETFRETDLGNYMPRIEFWETALPILERIPERYFDPTKKTKTCITTTFNILARIDRKVMKKYKKQEEL